MRHRKKLLLATVLLATAYAALCFWPHSNPEAVRALNAARELIEIDDSTEPPPFGEAKPRGDVQIEVRVWIATINMTDATAGLFAEPGRVRNKAVMGRFKSDRDFSEVIQGTSYIQIESRPVLMALSGQRARVAIGESVAIPALAPAGVGAAPAPLSFRDLGNTFSVSPQITAAGNILLDMECEVSFAGRTKKVATPQGPKDIPEVHTIATKARAEAKIGETLVIGGLSHKRPERIMFKLPGIGDMPGIGSWFQFTREREIEEELVILVTPRIVTPVMAK